MTDSQVDLLIAVGFFSLYLLSISVFYWARTPELSSWKRLACSVHGIAWLTALALALWCSDYGNGEFALRVGQGVYLVLISMALISNVVAFLAPKIEPKEHVIVQGLAMPFELASLLMGSAEITHLPL
ncbi:MAG: hypothetical protein V3W41_12010 [Planctomycetota bacterium]